MLSEIIKLKEKIKILNKQLAQLNDELHEKSKLYDTHLEILKSYFDKIMLDIYNEIHLLKK
jgi:hypothetical protein